MQGYAVHNDKSYTIYIQYLQHHIHISTGKKKKKKRLEQSKMCNIFKPCIIWFLRDFFYTAVYRISTALRNHAGHSFIQVSIRRVNTE